MLQSTTTHHRRSNPRSTSNSSFEKREFSLSCHARCGLGRQSNLKRDRKSRKASIFGSLDQLLSNVDNIDKESVADDLSSCDGSFACDEVSSVDLKVEEKNGKVTLKEPKRKSIVRRTSSNGSLGALTAGARSLTKGAKKVLRSSNENLRGSLLGSSVSIRNRGGRGAGRGSLEDHEDEETSLARRKKLLLGNTSKHSFGATKKSSTKPRKSKSTGKSKNDKIFKASQAETLAMLVAQELDDMDC